ncbi:MAG: phosphoribosylaminoimidazolesuccinocarboxamide synthase [Eubacteriales bacterium]|jgi:phosphoribosylaminoimidazole-succinocarboxamide synthase|nr:phosphoribosylaminoimidazolesuccinocarboxamide synthase [Eubacteriales bacterium]MDD4104540.1 phosphoribosylaminoimidazolesuccinocarboxamide synthase [Eubacteriales bacterium]MDD4710123.1 phosphoribosylaminoimidazolesuccinocarboxamide synthase [Eubacteriales bacterium]NLO14616.1 phosphoribosylaminoimidazolesuccinocarboxamide synthase [Clostridiales bacterium]
MAGTLLYKGKTKDVYQMDDGHYLLRFKDDVTGENGVFDPGANTVGLSIEGMGGQNLAMSCVFFELLHSKGIRTHYLTCDLSDNTMTVLPAKPFGKGLEVICRLRAVGSFLRRYGGYIDENAKLDYYVEMTLKDDGRQDPLITREALRQLNIMSLEQYDMIEQMTKDITRIIANSLEERALELYDIKLEFGLSAGAIILMDEISSGNMRVYTGSAYLPPLQLTARILG